MNKKTFLQMVFGGALGFLGGCGIDATEAAPIDSSQRGATVAVGSPAIVDVATLGNVGASALTGTGKVVFRQNTSLLETWLNMVGNLFEGVTLSTKTTPTGGGLNSLATYGVDLSTLQLDKIDVDERKTCSKAAIGNLVVKADYTAKIGTIDIAFDATNDKATVNATIDKFAFSNASFAAWTYIVNSTWTWVACALSPVLCLATAVTCEAYESCGGYYCLPVEGTFSSVAASDIKLTFTYKPTLSSSGVWKLARESTNVDSYNITAGNAISEALLNALSGYILDVTWFDTIGDSFATALNGFFGTQARTGYALTLPWNFLVATSMGATGAGVGTKATTTTTFTTDNDTAIALTGSATSISSGYADLSAAVSYDVTSATTGVRSDYASTTTLATTGNYPYSMSINTAVPNQLLTAAYERGNFNVTKSDDSTSTFRSILTALPSGQTFAYTVKANSAPYVDFTSSASPRLRFASVTVSMSVAGTAVAEVWYDVAVPLSVAVNSSNIVTLTPTYDSATVNSTTIVSQSGSLASTSSSTFGSAASKFLKKTFFTSALNLIKQGFYSGTGLIWPGIYAKSSTSDGWLNIYFNFSF